jgi:ribosome-binding factor A
VYGSEQELEGTAVALASATGVIRSEVGRQTGIKHTPSIAFQLDKIPDTARNIEDLVARAREADAAVAATRVGAVPAGDPDPYRTPGESDPDDEDDQLSEIPVDADQDTGYSHS